MQWICAVTSGSELCKKVTCHVFACICLFAYVCSVDAIKWQLNVGLKALKVPPDGLEAAQAAALVRNNTVPVNVLRRELDLSELSTVLSKGAEWLG